MMKKITKKKWLKSETRLNGGTPKRTTLLLTKAVPSRDNPVPNRMAARQFPGIYMVLCLVNNKRYFGESQNVSAGLSQQKSRLRRNIHEVPELQRDFNLYGEDLFEFVCLYVDKDLGKEKRVAMEVEQIARYWLSNLCYNKFDKITRKKETNPFYGQSHLPEAKNQISQKGKTPEGFAIVLKGSVYPSISEASRQTNHSRDTIRRWLKDPNNTDCVSVDDSRPPKSNEMK